MNANTSTALRLSYFETGCTTPSKEIALTKGALHTWTGNQVGLVIEAREGAAWLTQVGDGRDVVLARGESFRVNRPGRVVVESLTSLARLVVCHE